MVVGIGKRRSTPPLRSLILLGGALLLAGPTRGASPVDAKTVEARELTVQLARLGDRYRVVQGRERSALEQELLRVASERRRLLGELSYERPREVLRLAVPPTMTSTLPRTIAGLLETQREATGVLELVYEDREGAAELRHFLRTDQGRVALHFTERPDGLRPGMTLNVSGVSLTPDAVVAGVDEGAVLELEAASGTGTGEIAGTMGPHSTLVLLVNFAGRSEEPLSTAEADDLLFGTTSDFFLESSYGQAWLTGDVHGWFTVPVDSAQGCRYQEFADEADAQARASGIDLDAYDRHVYVLRLATGCTWSGAGTIGGSPSRAWINGRYEVKTVAHELGHNLGLYHSHGMDCGDEPIGNGCQTFEYGDGLDVMGNSNPAHFNAFQKQRLGWLDAGASPPIERVELTGVYTMAPYEDASAGPKALQVPRATNPQTGARTWYYIEYRQPIGFDDFLAEDRYDDVVQGVVVRIGTESDPDSSFALDMRPDDEFGRALVAGESFTDAEAGFTITTQATVASGATVQIDFGPQSCTRSDPDVQVNPAEGPWVEPGASVDYAISVTSQDSAACPAASFGLDVMVPAAWSAAWSESVVNLAPGGSATATVTLASPPDEADGFYELLVTAVHDAAPDRFDTATATYVVHASPPDSPPETSNDRVVTLQNTPLVIDVLANDQDPEGQSLRLVSVAAPEHGDAVVNGDDTVTYSPDPGYRGRDRFDYVVTDGENVAGGTVVVFVKKRNGGNGPHPLRERGRGRR